MSEIDSCSLVRKSGRDPTAGFLSKRDVAILLDKIRNNHDDTVVLKIKDHMLSDINTIILSSIFEALKENNVCVRDLSAFHNFSRFQNYNTHHSLLISSKRYMHRT